MEINFKPATGFLIARIVAPGETAGGIIVPDTANHHTLYLVEASEGHCIQGVMVPCKALPGSQIIPTPDVKMFNNHQLPKDHVLMQLVHVAAFTPPTVQA